MDKNNVEIYDDGRGVKMFKKTMQIINGSIVDHRLEPVPGFPNWNEQHWWKMNENR